MNGVVETKSGVLGRGPIFWGLLVLIATAAQIALGVSGAVENKSVVKMLLIIPIVLALIMFKSAYDMSGSIDQACTAKGQAQKRYIKRTAIFTSLYLATFALLMFADRQLSVSQEIKFALALLPGFAITGVFWAIGRLIVEEQDEFMRMLVVRQTLIATALALSAATIWGFLESAGVVVHIDAYWWAVLWFAGLAIGAGSNRIQYGTWGAV